MNLEHDELIRYSRQLMLPEVGTSGQLNLRNAHALILGAGGLGCPAALYLARSGVGKLTIVDPDTIELSNLHRQILYKPSDVGRHKAECAANMLADDCNAIAITQKLEGDKLLQAMRGADVVLDCCDNFASRYAHNATAFSARKPLVSGAAIRLEGQLGVFDFRDGSGPCYQCLYPQTDAEGQNCATAGILPPVVGMIGAMQALEATKLLLGFEVSSKLQVLNAQRLEWRTLQVAPVTDCPTCGP